MAPINNIPDYDLLAKYFAGEASIAEIQEVEGWINSGNEQQFFELQDLWVNIGNNNDNFNVDNALDNVNIRINKANSLKKKRLISLSAVAAVLLILVISLVVLSPSKNLKHTEPLISYVSQDSISNLILSDGSKVKLNTNSKIEYEKDFNENRTIKLDGEAFFEVNHVSEKDKFIVHTNNLEISVIGTKFNIKDIENSEIVEVSVTEGIVKVRQINSEDFFEIKANEKLRFSKSDSGVSVEPLETNTDIYWITKKINFDNSSIYDVAATLSAIYNIEIELNISNPENLIINTSFEDNDLDEIIKILEITLDISADKHGDTIIIEDAVR